MSEGTPLPASVIKQNFQVESNNASKNSSTNEQRKIERLTPKELLDKFNLLKEQRPDEYSDDVLDRVYKLLEYKAEYPDKQVPYRYFQDVLDFRLYIELNGWAGVFPSLIDKYDHSFYQGVRRWVEHQVKIKDDPQLTKSLLMQIFPERKVKSNPRPKIKWKLAGNTNEQNLQISIQNVQALFLEQFPEFDKLFPRGEDGKIATDKIEKAKKFIEDRMEEIGRLKSINNKITVTCFGRFPSVISASFRSLGIDLQFNFVDERSGKCLDTSGEVLVTLAFLHKEFGCEYQTLRKRLKSILPRFGYGLNGHKVGLYSESEARRALNTQERLNNLPKPESQSEGRIAQNGKSWVTRRFIRNNYLGGHANTRKVSQLLKKTPFINGKAGNGQEEVYYLESEALKKVDSYYSLPKADLETGRCEFQGRRLISVETFSKELGENETTLRSHLKKLGVYSLLGRGRGSGHSSILFDEDEALKLLKEEGFFGRKKPKPEGYWTRETIEEALVQFYKDKGNISQSLLISEGRRDLLSAVSKFPSLFQSVKEKLGLKQSKETITPEEAWRVIDMFFE